MMSTLKIEELMKEIPALKRGSDKEFDITRLPFGIIPLDELTGGGIPRKRITIIAGPPNVGKTYIASQAAANVQKQGGSVVWLDLELSWDPVWMAQCGVDVENILVTQPMTGEETFDIAKKVALGGVDLIVLDSIAGLVPTNIQEESYSYNPMAWQARFVNQSLPKFLPNLQHGSAFVAINQLRSSIGPVSLENMPGGLAQAYFAHFLLSVRREGWIKEKDVKVGFDIKVMCRKSKVGGLPYQECIVPFRLKGGIDLVEMVIRDAIASGLVIRKGPWYAFGEERASGMNGLKKLLLEKPEVLEEIKKQLSAEEVEI